MSQLIKRQLDTLRFLNRTKPSVVKSVIQNCDKDLLDAICECSLNILKGKVPLKPSEHKLLNRYKNYLRVLIKKSTSQKKKRAFLQKGGFLQALLTPVLTLLDRIIS